VLTQRAVKAMGRENVTRLNNSPESFTNNGGIQVSIDASGSGDPVAVADAVKRVLPGALRDAIRTRRVAL